MQPYRRIYHYHIQSAGTSLNAAFWALGGFDLRKMGDKQEVVGNGLKFVRHGSRLIAAGNYFFANSHYPAYCLHIPEETFTITILFDPIAHLLLSLSALGSGEPLRKPRGAGDREPPQRGHDPGRQRQRVSGTRTGVPSAATDLYVFGAVRSLRGRGRILRCSAVCFTETFREDLRHLAEILQLDLGEAGASVWREGVAEEQIELLRQRLAPEYAMIARVNDALGR